MACIICGLDTGDLCVPLCEQHVQLAEMCYLVERGELSDWEYEAPGGHIEYMMGEVNSLDKGTWREHIAEILAQA